ncbi:MAG: M48 family metalloprotease [Alphaproteobacteria bacterium]|nr:M48 family metalloprotease [Alphaproteobacteria bacterium]
MLARTKARFLLALLLIIGLLAPSPAAAQSMRFIRDAEIEAYLHALSAPVFKAADLDPKAINLIIIQDGELNAFVAGGMNIFLHTGLLLATETPAQLQGVIAHETGHIAGGHLLRGQQAMKRASIEAIIALLAGIAVGVASGSAEAAMGTVSGSQHYIERTLLRYSRAQESAADAAAMRFLDRAGLSSQGLHDFMNKLAGQDALPLERQAAYVRTHPLSQDRVQAIESHIKNNPNLKGRFMPEELATAHARMKAKLSGFLQPQTVLLRTTDKDPKPEARYARAIAFYRTGQLERALALMDSLLEDEPQNPFFLELKGQMLFENGRVKDSIPFYARAVALWPDSALIHQAYAHALLESKDDSKLEPAIRSLLEANRLEPQSPETWRLLAMAWNRQGELTKDDQYQGLVAYAQAESLMSQGKEQSAGRYATKALKHLKKDSPYWIRAQDIKLSAAESVRD